MPYYEYRCEQCGEEFEIVASIKEKTAGLDPECPKCHAKMTRQVITAGVVLRGGGGAPLAMPMPGCGPSAGPGCC